MLIIRYLVTIAFLLLTSSPPLMAAPFLYSANSNDTISVVDLATDSEVITIHDTISQPTKICLNPLTPTAYVLNSGTNTISVIDTSTNTVSATITDIRFTKLLALACSPDGTRVYVTNESTQNAIYIIDATTNTVLSDAVSIASSPDEIVLNKDGSKAYILSLATTPYLYIVNTATKVVSDEVPVTEGAYLLATHGNDTYVYILNSLTKTLEVRDPDTGNPLNSIPILDLPYLLKPDHVSNLVYIVSESSFKSVNPEDGQLVPLNNVFNDDILLALELSSDASKLFVAIVGTDTLLSYSTQDFSALPIPITLTQYSAPQSLATLHGTRHQLTINAYGNGTGTVSWPINLTYPDTNTKSILVPENISVSIKAEAAQNSFITWTGCDSVTGNGTSIAVCTINPRTSDKTVNAMFLSAAAITSPTNTSAFTGTTQTFTWNNAGADSYQLWIGTGVGKTDLGVYSTTATTANATGLPANGSTVYVKLHSRFGSTWYTNSYTYTASGTPPPAAAVISSPVGGSTLAGATQTFTWNNAGADSYQLWIGTGAGKTDLGVYSTTATTANATGLPANGSTVYVALHSRFGTTWYTSSYTYTASGTPAAAVISSPVGGSTLAGTTQAFTWNNAGANSYQLWIGTASGKYDLGMYSTTATTANATGLPANGGTVYVTLHSRFGTTWYSNSYTYNASGTPAAAVISSPVGGSALAGTTQTFTWNNAGANSYQLWIGTAAGKFDLGVYSTTGTTANATGLPANGSTVYVQLNSRFGTTWLKNNYSYISGPP